jgi:superoxide dismutase, Fe-Mn family
VNVTIVRSGDAVSDDKRTVASLLGNIDVSDIVKRSLRGAGAPVPSPVLAEGYVAQAKPYEQVSELVSAKTKGAHKELYLGYVEALNRTAAELDTADRASAGPNKSAFRDLKLAEAQNANAVWLHELYFKNCFDPHSEIYLNTKAYMRLERDWGTFNDAQRDIVACCMAARDGWMVLGYSMYLKRLICTVIDGESQHVLMGLYPLIVIDMHEHAYFRDYLTDKTSYIVAMMREINWQVVEERFERLEKIEAALK